MNAIFLEYKGMLRRVLSGVQLLAPSISMKPEDAAPLPPTRSAPWPLVPRVQGERPPVTRRQRLLHAARVLVSGLDPDPKRTGLAETPDRVVAAWLEWTEGYEQDPAEVLKVFEDGAEGCDQMVIVKDIPVYSHCEHHLAAIFGTATIAYIPDGRIVGLSKLSRLTDVFARRLQVQERMTNQIADALQTHLAPKGVGVLVRARHMCMESRGINQQGHHTVTSALRGAMRDDATARAEFLELAR